MESFKDFNLSSEIIQDLDAKKITKPTLVQEKTIPVILKGNDLLVQSETGSGKTLCFALPSIQMIQKGKGIQALIIAPTRELAKQVANEYEKFSKSKGLKIAIVYGGVSINNQIVSTATSEIVVGTPGRLLDLINRNALHLKCCPMLIIDEADKLMEMGFIEDIQRIIKEMPAKKQTLMFSATINSQINRIVEKYLNNPVKVILENMIKNLILKQYYYDVNSKDKISLLIHLLKKETRGLVLIFANTKHQTRFLSKVLQKNGIKSDCLNGDMSQNLREKVMQEFARGKIDALIATDVAARGIHIDDITHVINFDLPDESETYLHRIGRTARSGKKGTAIILLSEKDYQNMDKIKRGLKQPIEKKEVEFEKIKVDYPSRNNSNMRNSREGSGRNFRREGPSRDFRHEGSSRGRDSRSEGSSRGRNFRHDDSDSR
ncbi:MAG: DEAD/DEAH box helicase, partial [Candidatus Nanoarchaeia archaeon]|nr:DEAD/DEAH box helicase [Candidatus Nanoarchaeia archaeon]